MYKEYNYEWSKFGEIIRKIISYFGLSLYKDWSYCDNMWVIAINNLNFRLNEYFLLKNKKICKEILQDLYNLDSDILIFYKNSYENNIYMKNSENYKFIKFIYPLIIEIIENNNSGKI